MFITDSTVQGQCDPASKLLNWDAGANYSWSNQLPEQNVPCHIQTLCSPPHWGQKEVRRGPWGGARVGKRCVQSSPGKYSFLWVGSLRLPPLNRGLLQLRLLYDVFVFACTLLFYCYDSHSFLTVSQWAELFLFTLIFWMLEYITSI